MKELLLKADDISRRQFVNCAAQTLLGVTVWGHATSLKGQEAAPAAPTGTGHSAKSCIYLYMSGGMTHLDTLTLSLARLKVVLFKAFAPKLTM